MNGPQATWDGKRWVSADKRWVWTGDAWMAFGSTFRPAARLSIYAAVGVAVNLPAFFVLGLTWGLTGPGWDANPPVNGTSFVQVAVTATCAGAIFLAGWFLIRIDRRDWWLGLLLAWPWIASGVSLALVSAGAISALLLSACLMVAAALPILGPILGRWHRWPTSRSTASEQLKWNSETPQQAPVAANPFPGVVQSTDTSGAVSHHLLPTEADIDWPVLISELEAIAIAELGDRSEPFRSILSRAEPSLEGVTDAIAQVERARVRFVDPVRIGDLGYSMRVRLADRTGAAQPPRSGGRALWSGEGNIIGTPVGCTPVVIFTALVAMAIFRS